MKIKNWKLMHDDAISNTDREKMCDFIQSGSRLSYGEKVKEFEKEWSNWFGCKVLCFCKFWFVCKSSFNDNAKNKIS